MANWSNPLLTSTYTNFLAEVKDRDTDLALQFDGTTSTNIPTNTIRWNSSANRWQKWNGSTWGELTSTYALTGLTTTGNATIGGTLTAAGLINTDSVSGTALLPTGNTVPTNGIYLPSANVLGIATSSTARLIIDASGNVGIGTLSPATGLHVGNTAASATAGNLYISPTAAAGQARLRLYNGGAQAEWLLGQKTSSDHAFKLSKLVSGSESDFFTVDTVGNLSLPATGMRLRFGRILDADVNDAALTLYGGTNDGANIELFGGAHATFANLIVIDAGEHRFRSANGATERMRIDSSGRVGIGTSSPATSLDIGTGGMARVASASGNNQIQVSTGSNGLGMWAGGATRLYTTGGMTFSVNSTIGTGIPTGYTDALTIDSSGQLTVAAKANGLTNGAVFNVPYTGGQANGISLALQVAGTGNTNALARISMSTVDLTSNNASYISFATSPGGVGAPSGDLATERLRIDSSGRVGIGTTTPLAPIHVSSTPTGTSNIYVAPTTAGLAAVEVYNGGSTCGWRTGQRSSSDHDWSLDQMVAGVAYNKFQITATGVLKFDSGYGSTANAYGCRAWVNFNGTGTVAIRASANVSSITDNGAGDYTVNFTTTMPDANYAAITDVPAGGNRTSNADVYAAGSVRVLTYLTGLTDTPTMSVAIFR